MEEYNEIIKAIEDISDRVKSNQEYHFCMKSLEAIRLARAERMLQGLEDGEYLVKP